MLAIGGNYLGNIQHVSTLRAPMPTERVPEKSSPAPKMFHGIKEAMGEIPKPVYWFGAAALVFWYLRKRERDVGTPMFL